VAHAVADEPLDIPWWVSNALMGTPSL